MRLISFVVPSYNAEKFLNKSVSSLLCGKEDIEIIIVNDGSKDSTLKIANDFQKNYPNIIKVIDKENGGHGSTINEAIKIAQGIYFKCLDADDWIDKDALEYFLKKIKEDIKNECEPDLYLTNFVYQNILKNESHINTLKKYFVVGKTITWEKVKKIPDTKIFMMHMFTFKLDIIKASKLELPLHTFYVDNLFVYYPLYYVKTICYLDINLYQYLVGQQNQSVSVTSIDKNYKDQLKVFHIASLLYPYDKLKKLNKSHRFILLKMYFAIFYLTLYFISVGKSKNKKKDYKQIMREVKEKNPGLIKIGYFSFPFNILYLSPPFLKKIMIKIGRFLMNKKTSWN